MSASRPLADLRDAESRDKEFHVGLPLQSRHRAPTSLMSPCDPKRSLAMLEAVEHWFLTTLREKLVKISAKVVRRRATIGGRGRPVNSPIARRWNFVVV